MSNKYGRRQERDHYNEIFIFRFVDGRIAETWGVVDVFSQMKQLGGEDGTVGAAR